MAFKYMDYFDMYFVGLMKSIVLILIHDFPKPAEMGFEYTYSVKEINPIKSD